MALLRFLNHQNVAKLNSIKNSKSFLLFEQSCQNSFPVVLYSSSTSSVQDGSTKSSVFNGQQRKNVSSSASVKDPLDLSFANPEAAFKSKTTWEVIRAYLVYQMCSSSFLVDNNMQLMKIGKAILGEKMFAQLMKLTFYGHFVAGEDQYKIVPVLQRLHSFGVKPILDYSVEEDISQEEAEKRELESSTSELEKTKEAAAITEDAEKIGGELPQYHVAKSFADRRYKVSSARTYFYLNEATCERNVEVFQDCLHAVAGATYGTGITAIKLTALGRPQLLLQLSEVIMRARKFTSEIMGGQGNVLGQNLTQETLEQRLQQAGITDTKKFMEKVTKDAQGVIHLFPWSGLLDVDSNLSETFRVPCLKEKRMVRLLSQLSKKEEEMFRNMVRRLNTLVRTANDLDVRIMIDAEQTYFQPAISRLTMELMQKYNTEKAIVFNTYQCYLRETLNEVITDLNQAKRQKFYFGAKLVRGAYMEQERARAAALGYPDPVNPNYAATSEMYHNTLTECLRRIKDLKNAGQPANKVGIMVASHNEDTVRFALQKMKDIGISPEDKVICFGQLLGMCDYITFPLGQAGYSAYKYIPYGPVNEVLPYLSRRATENKGVLEKIAKEKRLLRQELVRRLKSGKIFYTPKGHYTPI